MNNIFKSIAQRLVNAALPAVKAELMSRAALLGHDPKYSAVAPLLLPFLSDVLDKWTIKL